MNLGPTSLSQGSRGERGGKGSTMPGEKSKGWNVHLECSVSLSLFLHSQQLLGSLKRLVHCAC